MTSQIPISRKGRPRQENIGYYALHYRIRAILPKPEYCEICGIRSPEEIACITGVYNEDLSNWKYLCFKCHKKLDQTIDMTDRICSVCGGSETLIDKRNGRPRWYHSKPDRELLCQKCFDKSRCS